MGIPRRDRRTSRAGLTGSAMGRDADGSDVTEIVPQSGKDAAGAARQARAERTRCVSGGTHDPGVSSSSHPRARLHIGDEASQGAHSQRGASQPSPTNTPRRTSTANARARARALDPLRGGAQPDDGTDHKGDEAMRREHHNGSRTGAAGALSALTRLLGRGSGR